MASSNRKPAVVKTLTHPEPEKPARTNLNKMRQVVTAANDLIFASNIEINFYIYRWTCQHGKSLKSIAKAKFEL